MIATPANCVGCVHSLISKATATAAAGGRQCATGDIPRCDMCSSLCSVDETRAMRQFSTELVLLFRRTGWNVSSPVVHSLRRERVREQPATSECERRLAIWTTVAGGARAGALSADRDGPSWNVPPSPCPFLNWPTWAPPVQEGASLEPELGQLAALIQHSPCAWRTSREQTRATWKT